MNSLEQNRLDYIHHREREMASDGSYFQFYRERKREPREKVEEIHAWIKTFSSGDNTAWAVLFVDGKKDVHSLSGVSVTGSIDSPDSTGQRVELLPVKEFLLMLPSDDKKRRITFYSESIYISNLLNEWMDRWRKSDFKLLSGEERPNSDLLREIDEYRERVSFSVRNSFSPNEFTEKVEKLCREELSRADE